MSIVKLYIDEAVVDLPQVRGIHERLDLPATVISDERALFQVISQGDDPIRNSKGILYLTRNKGAFVKKCPGTRDYTCCGYQILHIGTFCTMDCTYCILQAYYHPPVLRHYVNYQDMFLALDGLFSQATVSRIGTGEFTDSLIWEPWTDLSRLLVPAFGQQSRALLELKTKTTAIETLKDLHHNGKTVLAWSLNTDRVIQNEERGTTSLTARLRAAATCASWGYPVAFHFDPMVIYDGCEDQYRGVIDQLFSHISPDSVAWISLGTFRFMPALKAVIEDRFPDSKMIYGEFIAGLDGKMRYFKPLRIELYRQIVSRIREEAPGVLVYLCMEDDEVWEKSLGFIPSDRGGLPRMLDERAIDHGGLDGKISS